MSKFRGGEGKTEGKSATHLGPSASSRPRIHHTVTQGHTKTSCLMAEQSWTPWMWEDGEDGLEMEWRCQDGHSRMKAWAQLYLSSFGPGWGLSVQLPPPAGLCRQLIFINLYSENMKSKRWSCLHRAATAKEGVSQNGFQIKPINFIFPCKGLAASLKRVFPAWCQSHR